MLFHIFQRKTYQRNIEEIRGYCLAAVIHVADVLAKYAKKGTSTESDWPYRVVII
jgi:hypothetical protein